MLFLQHIQAGVEKLTKMNRGKNDRQASRSFLHFLFLLDLENESKHKKKGTPYYARVRKKIYQ
jgi:hypothetical protein